MEKGKEDTRPGSKDQSHERPVNTPAKVKDINFATHIK